MRLSGFEIREEIGTGERSWFRARRTSDGQSVLLRPAERSLGSPTVNLRRELEISQGFDIDGVVRAIDLIGGQSPVLVLADTPGVPLSLVLSRRGGPLPLATALEIAARLAGILSDLHRYSFVHFDLRPVNIFYDEDSRRVSLTGLGRARKAGSRIHASDRLKGDPAYLAPEATGRLNQPLESRTDLYSLGVALFEMLAGRPPFEDGDAATLVHAHLALQPPDLATLRSGDPSRFPQILVTVVEKLLAKSGEDRYQSATGLKHDLELCLEDLKAGRDIAFFEPGQRDRKERFEIPQTLLGRQVELQWLNEALVEVAKGHPVVRLVAGFSGVGKTALIAELQRSVQRRGGLFAAGALDQTTSSTPYGGVLSALRRLVAQALAAEPQTTEHHLAQDLGDQLGVVTEAIPELAHLASKSAVQRLEGENARNRFHGGLRTLLASLASLGHRLGGASLVIFLDDLQWIDAASLELLRSLLGDASIGWLLLGAYRDNLVSDEHALSQTVAELSATGLDIDSMRLRPLGEDVIVQLVADTLHVPPSQASALAALVYRKTAGNPFFARTFLQRLHQQQLIQWRKADESPSGWSWDLEAIQRLGATENVVDLVASQLTDLSPESRRLLAEASVFGMTLDTPLLSRIHDTHRDVDELLLEACRLGLLVENHAADRANEPPGYVFTHARIREGACELLSAEERAAVHLRIGRLLSARDDANHDVFEIADHLHHAAHLLTSREEHFRLVDLSTAAGRQARASGAFSTAAAYFCRALDHLHGTSVQGPSSQGDGPWRTDYELTRSLHAEAAEAASLARDFDVANRLASELRQKARSLLDGIAAYETEIYVLYAQREEETAIDLSIEVLSRLGIDIPRHPEAQDLEATLTIAEAAVESALQQVEKDGIQSLPIMRDREQLAAMRLLARTALHAGWHRLRLFRLIACRLATLTAQSGVGPSSAMACVLMAEVRCGVLHDVEGGRRVGELGLALARHLGAGGVLATCEMLLELFVGTRTTHPAELQERFARLFQNNLEAGDLLAAGACGVQHSLAGFLVGQDLTRVEQSAREHGARVQSSGQLMMAQSITGMAKIAAALRGRGDLENALESPRGEISADRNVRVRLIGLEMLTRLILRQPARALHAATESLDIPSGAIPLVPFDFYRCLIFLDFALSEGSQPEHPLESCRERLELRARAAPNLYQHKLQLVNAHATRLAGKRQEALELYEQAIAGALDNDFPHEAALAHELAAEHCRAEGEGIWRERARTHLREAQAGYRRWGAVAKLDHLLRRYPELSQAEDLDVSSLEKARRALATELDLSKLLRRLMALLLENAGARRGLLLRETPDGLVIDALGEKNEVRLTHEQPIDDDRDFAASIVRFVGRTQETVVLDNAQKDPRFESDPYLASARSILCFPLLHQGRTVEIVYLENDYSSNVFSAERTTACRLLASHATAALENARLYQSLEKEVETRRRAEAELATLKDRLQAENVYLQEEIGSQFEEIVGNSEAMRKVLYKVEQVAATDATVLILGETGTGKELIARALHRLSPRRDRPLVKVNCAALPTTLIESELFGHEKGAFTGALSRKVGRFELANSGTLFLDEIGDLPLELQAKLLRVLQEGEIERLGGTRTIHVDVRIIAATNRDLDKAMVEGTFRPDLYYRLTVFPIELPPLRERLGDVPLLAHFFVERKRGKLGRSVEKIPQDVMSRFSAYGWPGNVRELSNVVERALILSPGDTLCLDEPLGSRAPAPSSDKLIDLERIHVRKILEACGWKVKGPGNAAERLGLTPPTLRNRMKKLGIERPT